MSERFVRVYQQLDVYEIQKHLLIHGELSATCGKCQEINLKLSDPVCPKCKAEFKYIAFRNIQSHIPKLQKLSAQRPSITFVDYDDFKKHLGALKAEDFWK